MRSFISLLLSPGWDSNPRIISFADCAVNHSGTQTLVELQGFEPQSYESESYVLAVVRKLNDNEQFRSLEPSESL